MEELITNGDIATLKLLQSSMSESEFNELLINTIISKARLMKHFDTYIQGIYQSNAFNISGAIINEKDLLKSYISISGDMSWFFNPILLALGYTLHNRNGLENYEKIC